MNFIKRFFRWLNSVDNDGWQVGNIVVCLEDTGWADKGEAVEVMLLPGMEEYDEFPFSDAEKGFVDTNETWHYRLRFRLANAEETERFLQEEKNSGGGKTLKDMLDAMPKMVEKKVSKKKASKKKVSKKKVSKRK